MEATINDILKHHGVKGMKWGVRKDRKGSDGNRSRDYKEAAGLRKKRLSEMSNDEIAKVIRRLSLERKLKDLAPEKRTASERLFGRFLRDTGDRVVSKASGYAADEAWKIVLAELERKNKS